jgi:hypothetical protein
MLTRQTAREELGTKSPRTSWRITPFPQLGVVSNCPFRLHDPHNILISATMLPKDNFALRKLNPAIAGEKIRPTHWILLAICRESN